MKKIFGIIIILLAFVAIPFSNIVVAANITPTVSIYPPSSSTVENGGSVSYRVVANNATSFNISSSDIGLARGVRADISIQTINSNEKLIVLSNIRGNVGLSGYIAIKAGVAQNGGASSKTTPASPAFTIIEEKTVVTPEVNTNNQNQTTNTNSNQEEIVNNNNAIKNEENSNQESTPVVKSDDTENPALSISKASLTSIKPGEEITYTVEYTDNAEMGEITLNERDITLYGFNADITVSGEGNTRKITLSNIQGSLGGLKYIVISANTASDKAGNKIKENTKSGYFKLVDDSVASKPDDWIENPNTGK